MSLYFSRLVLNPGSARARADLRSAYELHRTVSTAFGSDADSFKAARCLFRLDENPAPAQVLVQSLCAPDWSRLDERYLAVPVEVKEVQLALREGQRLRFRLLANPTRRESGNHQVDPVSGKAKDGARRALVFPKEPAKTEAACRDWLKRKGETGGFEPVLFDVEDCGVVSVTKGGKRTPYAAIQFDGVLQVTDPQAMLETLATGIGTAKGFGFGLLSLAPA